MSHEGDSYAEVYRSEVRRAAKDHWCTACGELIATGNEYVDVFVVYEGDRYRSKRCARCEGIHAHLRDKCRAACDGRAPADDLDCGEDYRDNWGEEPPPEIAALAFALPGEMKIRRPTT